LVAFFKMDTDWENWEPNMRATLVFVKRGCEVLLIHKKRGLGAGKINGPGGKIELGETPLQAAVREVEEELKITPVDLEEMGTLHFQFVDGLAIHCVVYTAAGFRGTPEETDEAIPAWFEVDEIPYDRMWQDDQYWLPRMLGGERFSAYFDFDDELMLSKQIEWQH